MSWLKGARNICFNLKVLIKQGELFWSVGVFKILGIHMKKSGTILNSSEIILNFIYGTENYHILCNFSEDNIYISFKINLLPIQVFVYV